jgi:hypothetical protein
MRSSSVASGFGAIVGENAVWFQAVRRAKALKAASRRVKWAAPVCAELGRSDDCGYDSGAAQATTA